MTLERYNELLDAAALLKNHCSVTETECPFAIGAKECYKREHCALESGFPPKWDLPKRKIKWKESEKAVARCLKTAGVVSIRRSNDREMVVELFGLGMAPMGSVPYAVFPNAEYNRAVLLRDIIGEDS